MSVVAVYVTFASAEEAERIGRIVVEERLAACINILGSCRSIYHWQGEIETADEVAAILKTTDARADALIAQLKEVHGYDEPCIAAWPIERISQSYARWVEDSVRI